MYSQTMGHLLFLATLDNFLIYYPLTVYSDLSRNILSFSSFVKLCMSSLSEGWPHLSPSVCQNSLGGNFLTGFLISAVLWFGGSQTCVPQESPAALTKTQFPRSHPRGSRSVDLEQSLGMSLPTQPPGAAEAPGRVGAPSEDHRRWGGRALGGPRAGGGRALRGPQAGGGGATPSEDHGFSLLPFHPPPGLFSKGLPSIGQFPTCWHSPMNRKKPFTERKGGEGRRGSK